MTPLLCNVLYRVQLSVSSWVGTLLYVRTKYVHTVRAVRAVHASPAMGLESGGGGLQDAVSPGRQCCHSRYLYIQLPSSHELPS